MGGSIFFENGSLPKLSRDWHVWHRTETRKECTEL